MRKSLTLLLGAGAFVEIGSPSTKQLTGLIIDSFKESKYTELFSKIQTIIKEQKESPNFEDIYSILFEILECSKYSDHTIPKDFFGFDTKSFLDSFDFFIPKNDLERFDYYDICLNKYLKIIIDKIYDFENNSLCCENFIDDIVYFFEKISSEYDVLRIYTLNYDNWLFNLLNKHGLCVKNGFDTNNTYTNNITSEENTYLSLHGNIKWIIETINKQSEIRQGEIRRNSYLENGFKDSDYTYSTITTGHQIQKISNLKINPYFNNFEHFKYDCKNSDKIITIGYSHRDNHINSELTNCRNLFSVEYSKENEDLNDWKILDNRKVNYSGFKNFLSRKIYLSILK